MSEIKVKTQLGMVITIINHDSGAEIAEVFKENNSRFGMLVKGKGTTSFELLDYLGFKSIGKDVLLNILPIDIALEIVNRLDDPSYLDMPNKGVSFVIPFNSWHKLKHSKSADTAHKEVEDMELSAKHSLILAVTARGFTEEVMEAAKKVRNTGGTVIHARGLGTKEAEKFFGITIQPEKDVVMIVADNEHCCTMMKSIVENAGPQTEAKTVCFSIPVIETAGFTDYLDFEE